MSETIYPNKSAYSIGEFVDELKKGSLWKKYAEANPKESAEFLEHVEKRIKGEADRTPLVSSVKTATGRALYMALGSLEAHPRSR